MAERQSAFASLMSYVGGDELLRQHPLVAEFVGATVRCLGVSLFLRGVVRAGLSHARGLAARRARALTHRARRRAAVPGGAAGGCQARRTA
jgi:hypothetical protein